jgi:hypothetical protein
MMAPRIEPAALRAFDDGLGPDLTPADLHRCGLSEAQVRQCLPHLFDSVQAFEVSGFRDINPQNYPGLVNEEKYQLAKFGAATHLHVASRGLAWLIEPLRVLQPQSHAVLAQPDNKLLVGFSFETSPSPVDPSFLRARVVLLAAGRAYAIWPHAPGWYPEERPPHKPHDAQAPLPEWLWMSWYQRMEAMFLMRGSSYFSLPWCGPIAPMPNWARLDEFFRPFAPAVRKRALASLKARFGEADWLTSYGAPNFTPFINTAVPETKPTLECDIIALHCGRNDKVLYHVHRGDFERLRHIPADVAQDVFDRYFAHVLSRTPGEFDFMPYSVEL